MFQNVGSWKFLVFQILKKNVKKLQQQTGEKTTFARFSRIALVFHYDFEPYDSIILVEKFKQVLLKIETTMWEGMFFVKKFD